MPEPSEEEPHKEQFRDTLNWIFSDDLMIALAVILAVTVILQILFEFSPGMLAVFEYLNYFIIFVFIAEYGLKLYAADSRISFITHPLHVLDLIIILLVLVDIPIIGPFSTLPDQARISPILRLIRIFPRALLALFLAGRTAKRLKANVDPLSSALSELQIATLDLKGNVNRNYANKASSLIVSDKMPIWIDFQKVKEIDFDVIEKIAMFPPGLLETKLQKESFPRIEPIGDILTIFLRDSQIISDGLSNETLNIYTNNMLIIFNEEKIITLSKGICGLFDKISREISHGISSRPIEVNLFTDKILHSLLQQKIADYSQIVHKIEHKTIEFEEIPVDKTSPKFLEQTFRFKKEILKISNNLWHFQRVLQQLTDSDYAKLFKIDNKHEFDDLYAKSGYLYENTQNIKESLISLIDLHTNTVSYDMNKVMKVIAVITCLAVIPATIGGLLGVNLIYGNFPIKISEIFFIVLSLMLLGIYAFYKMDWLK